jgi:tetratricopeptide (TPR) repeat protein
LAATEQTGSLSTALAHTERLLNANPAAAEEQAREILKAAPGMPQAQLLLGVALRLQGRLDDALAVLEPLAAQQARVAIAQLELGMTLGAMGQAKKARTAVARAISLSPKFPDAWRNLADQLTLAGDTEGADEAYALHLKASANDPKLMEAATALVEGRLAVAEHLLRGILKEHPTDVGAMRMLAEIGARLRRYEDAEALLSRALELAPGFSAARTNYAAILYRHNKPQEALEQLDVLLKDDPKSIGTRALKAAALGQLGEYDGASAIYEKLVQSGAAQHPKVWMSYGHTLKTQGKQKEAIATYRKSIALHPSLGEAYWSLANLKTVRFTEADIAAMEAQRARTDLSADDRLHFEFALAKSLEDAGQYEDAFTHYDRGNALRLKEIPYDAENTTDHVEASKAFFTPELIAARERTGDQSPDPIFIVGLPRAGSTLIEQILSSHSQVEGTMELHEIGNMARLIGGAGLKSKASDYPAALGRFSDEQLAAYGAEYLQRTRVYRKTDRPFFIDKMPNNFLHTGFIHLILPNAKIIDARRHPLGCCFSCFKQHFARGQSFTYSLADLGHYYADYVDLMAHYDRVLPGRVHRVIYENMVDDPEAEVRRLLDYCGLDFEEACLRFYENPRAVRTASSEQVRRPIFREGVEQWKNFEPWLGPLKGALGDVLTCYPDVPASIV